MPQQLFTSDGGLPSFWHKWNVAISQLCSFLGNSVYNRLTTPCVIWVILIYKWCLMSLMTFFSVFYWHDEWSVLRVRCHFTFHLQKTGRLQGYWPMLCSIQWAVLFGHWHIFDGFAVKITLELWGYYTKSCAYWDHLLHLYANNKLEDDSTWNYRVLHFFSV